MTAAADRDGRVGLASDADDPVDVVVVGAGNAGLSAALEAQSAGARVLIVDAAPSRWAGGNSALTGGAFRTTWGALDDLRDVVDVDDDLARRVDLAPYRADDYLDDLRRLGRGSVDEELARILAADAEPAVRWLAGHGVRWELLVGRQSFPVGDRVRFWGNLAVGVVGGGRRLVELETRAFLAGGGRLRHDTRFLDLVWRDGHVGGIRVAAPDGEGAIHARSVVLASGGFQADADRRATHLGPGWERVALRGTPHNAGDPLFRALEAGAARAGEWTGCHAVAWDAGAPADPDPVLAPRLSRQSYPWGLVVNRDGRRFLDEGADFRNYTYASYGAEILAQPDGLGYQLFDARTRPLVARGDYDAIPGSMAEAPSLEALAETAGIDAAGFIATVSTFNAAVNDRPFDPSVKDGRATIGIRPPKSNWAQRLEVPPFTSYAVTCGITFTFGGLRIDAEGRVLGHNTRPMPGLHACGEIVGLFHHNVPGGTGLTTGTVFGRRAGAAAAAWTLGQAR